LSGGVVLGTPLVTEERKSPRSEGIWPVVILTGRGAIVAETRNISPQGAFIFSDQPLPPEEKIRLLIMFPNRRYLDIPAEVTWSYPYGSEKDVTPCGMGVRFTEISAQDQEFISSLSSGYLKEEGEKGTL
jgi:hypothetical protein